MKRKGIILLETVLYILLLSLLAAAVLPFVGQTARLISLFEIRGRMTEQSLFAVDFMTEKLRNHLECTETAYTGNALTYRAYNEKKKKAEYRFLIRDDKLKVRLYNGVTQPVTGENISYKEEIAFLTPEGGSVFRRFEKGLVILSFEMVHTRSGEKRTVETAVLPYRDFYRSKPGALYKNGKA